MAASCTQWPKFFPTGILNQVPVMGLLTVDVDLEHVQPHTRQYFDMYDHLLESYWSVACEGWCLKAAGLVIMMSC